MREVESTANSVAREQPIGIRAELVLDAHAELAEGPVWDDRRRVLWWVDITSGRVHRFDPVTGVDRVLETGSPVGCVALREDGGLAIAAAETLLLLDPETETMTELAAFEPGPVAARCNDGKCDPQGRFWIDRMAYEKAPRTGSLMRFDGARLDTIVQGSTIPNGLDWSVDGSRMYFVDSKEPVVSVFDFDAETGGLANSRPFIRTTVTPGWPPSGVPDGLTVDRDDCVWVALWGGGCVLRFDPNGTPIGGVEVPVSRVSSCAFGGPDLDELYITTAWEDATADELDLQPHAGGIFRVRPGVRGRAPGRMRNAT